VTLKNTPAVISLPVSAAGTTHSSSQDGQQTSPCGPARVLASPSRPPESDVGQMTPDICGLSGAASSRSVDPRSSLGSKSHPQKLSALSKRLLFLSRFRTAITPARTSSLNDSPRSTDSIIGLGGSMEYKQTWREKVTPSGSRYWAHTASARRTSGNGYGGWHTPKCPSGGGQAERKTAGGGLRKLEDQALLAGWPTPNVPLGGRSRKGGMTTTGMTLDGKKRQVDLQHVARALGNNRYGLFAATANIGVSLDDRINARTAMAQCPKCKRELTEEWLGETNDEASLLRRKRRRG